MGDRGLGLIRAALLLGTVALLLGGLLAGVGSSRRASGAVGGPCVPLRGMATVAVTVRDGDGEVHRATAYETAEGDVLLPLQGLVEPYLSGAGIYWDGPRRTASLLGESDVLSVHFPTGREAADRAVLNGTVIPVRAVLCDEQLYLPAGLVGPMLKLEVDLAETGG